MILATHTFAPVLEAVMAMLVEDLTIEPADDVGEFFDLNITAPGVSVHVRLDVPTDSVVKGEITLGEAEAAFVRECLEVDYPELEFLAGPLTPTLYCGNWRAEALDPNMPVSVDGTMLERIGNMLWRGKLSPGWMPRTKFLEWFGIEAPDEVPFVAAEAA